LRYDWNGPRVVVSFAERNDEEGEVKAYRDTTLNDLRFALDNISKELNIFEDDTPNPFVIRNEKNWIKAVKVSCEDDVKFLDKAKYREVEITKYHPIFFQHDDISTVSQHIGWTLLAKKCPISPERESKIGQDRSFDPLCNVEALHTLTNTKPTAPVGRFGRVHYPKWDNAQDPTVLFARQDRKDATKYQVEALSRYCSAVAFGKMLEPEFGWGAKERKVIAKRFLSAEAFDGFFAGFADMKREMDVEGWDEAESPCDISSHDLVEAQGFTGDESDVELDEDPEDDLDAYGGPAAMIHQSMLRFHLADEELA
jgi:hypothetical protein